MHVEEETERNASKDIVERAVLNMEWGIGILMDAPEDYY